MDHMYFSFIYYIHMLLISAKDGRVPALRHEPSDQRGNHLLRFAAGLGASPHGAEFQTVYRRRACAHGGRRKV
jgi:hypothetical protein